MSIPTDVMPGRNYDKKECRETVRVIRKNGTTTEFICTLDKGHDGHCQAWGFDLKVAWKTEITEPR